MPSAFERRQPWPSDFLKIWKRRRSSSIGSWLQLGSAVAIHCQESSIWMKPLCDLSFSRAEPLNSVTAEPFQWSPVVPRRGALRWHSQLPPAVIFKGVRTPRDLTVPDSVCVSFHKKGWMDEKGKLLLCFFLYFKVCYTQITDFRNCRCIFNLGILLLISGVKQWIRTCLPRNPDNERSLLVWDSFRVRESRPAAA